MSTREQSNNLGGEFDMFFYTSKINMFFFSFPVRHVFFMFMYET